MTFKKSAVDFNGQEFPSYVEMAKFYGVEPNLVCMRLKRGMTLKQALTCQVGKYGCKRRRK